MGGDARAECVFSCSVLYGTGEEDGEARRSPPLVTESFGVVTLRACFLFSKWTEGDVTESSV